MDQFHMFNPRTFEGRVLPRQDEDPEDQGLAFDIGTILSRRKILGLIGVGAGSAALAACAPQVSITQTGATSSSSSASAIESAASVDTQNLVEMPSETNGPYPGDGTNGPDVLDMSGIARKDLTTSLDTSNSVEGVPFTQTIMVVDMAGGNVPFVSAAVYVWHCDAEGRYSMYSGGVTGESWLRGVQVADANGQVTFDTIVPGCYEGRWPHIHFEVFSSINDITDATTNVLTSQIAIPAETCEEVYADSRYASSVSPYSNISLESDNVFSDSYDLQMDTVTKQGDGYSASIVVGVDTTTEQEMSMAPGGGGGGPQGGPGQPPR